MKPSLEPFRALAGQLVALQAAARALGLFIGDRELLACPRCGLMEDVTCTGLLITCRPPALGKTAPKNSRIRPWNQCESDAISLPRRGNHVSLSSGERVGVRANFLASNSAHGSGADDTGLRFETIKPGKFRCPDCGGIVTEPPEEPPTKTNQAKRESRK